MFDGLHLLLVEDEPITRRRMAGYLRKEGFLVSEASHGGEMMRTLNKCRVDLILLDINLPGEDGLSLARKLRITGKIAIIIVTGRNEDIDRITGLEVGADDYMTKPFHPRELLARFKNVLRRTHESPSVAGEETGQRFFAGWYLDFDNRQLTAPNQTMIDLTRAEFDLLGILCRFPNQMLSREHLMPRVVQRKWMPQDRTIDVLVRRLRQKIEIDPANPDIIRTVHGEGYQFVAVVQGHPESSEST